MGLSQPADQMDAMAAELEAGITEWLDERLTLEQSAMESGYTYNHLQAQGVGYIINVASGGRISFEAGTLILLTVAAGYLMAGGLRAVYWTDVIQGIWMYIAVWVGALYLSYELFGGPLELWRRVAEERPDLLTLPGPHGFFTPGMWIGMTITLSFGIVFQPHMLMRYYTAVEAKTLKILGATTPIYLMTLFIPTALVGLGGALVMPGLEGQTSTIHSRTCVSFQSAFGHLKLRCEHSVGVGRHRNSKLFDWLVLRVIYKVPYSFFRWKSQDHNAFLRITLKRLCVEGRYDYFAVVFGDERENLRNVLASVRFEIGDCVRQNKVSGHASPPCCSIRAGVLLGVYSSGGTRKPHWFTLAP